LASLTGEKKRRSSVKSSAREDQRFSLVEGKISDKDEREGGAGRKSLRLHRPLEELIMILVKEGGGGGQFFVK